jgi:PAS domain S-box-containing protein
MHASSNAASPDRALTGLPSRGSRRGWLERSRLRIFTTVFLSGVVCFAAFLIVILTYLQDLQEQQALAVGAARVDQRLVPVREAISGIAADVFILGQNPSFRRFVAQRDDGARQETESVFNSTMRERPIFLRVQYIDAEGKELIRVDRQRYGIQIAPPDQLSDQSEQVFFLGARSLPPGSLYVSSIELTTRDGKVEEPWQPVMRLATPVFDPAGQGGVVVISLAGADMLAPFGRIEDEDDARVMLLDQDGYWLAGNERENLWGFMFGNDRTFAREHPAEWRAIAAGSRGHFRADDSLYSYTTINPVTEIKARSSVASGSGAIIAGPVRFWKVVHVETFSGTAAFLEPETIALCFTVMILLAAGSWVGSGVWWERHSAELRARAAARRAQDVLNFTDATVHIRDLDGRFTYVNGKYCSLVGLAEKQLLGRRPAEVVPSRAAETSRLIDDIKAGKPVSSGVKHFALSTGNRVLMTNAFPMYDEEGTFDAVGLVGVDITDLKHSEDALREAQEAAREANEAKSRFLANMSHELRTPLNVIIGYSEMLLEDSDDDLISDDIRKIHSAGRHLLGLINDILDLSKIEAGKMELFIEEFPLDGVIDEVEAAAGMLAANKSNQLVIKRDGTDRAIRSDSTKLKQILLNLVSNAAKFTDHGRIDISVKVAPRDGVDWLSVAVKDSGIGMTPDQMRNLFENFSQADSSITKKYQGTGLGLAICRRLSQMIGGDITVDSEPGLGTTFYVDVPANCGDSTPVAAPKSAERAPTDKNSALILVIDDEASARELVTRFLTREGFQVVTASGGLEGLERARNLQPDAITLDLWMEDMTGWEVLKALEEDPALRGIPVVMCTIADARNQALSLGAVECLTKPINRDSLVKTITKVTGGELPRTALIVDDEALNREMFGIHLKDLGYDVVMAQNGKEALNRLRDMEAPAFVILDLMMPEMDGFTFLREMRGERAWEAIPVIVVTAKTLSDAERVELKMGAQTIITKDGKGSDEVLQAVNRQLGRVMRTRLPKAS